MDSSEDKPKPRRCFFCESDGGNTLFVNTSNHSAICSDCVCKLMQHVYELESLRALDMDTTKGH